MRWRAGSAPSRCRRRRPWRRCRRCSPAICRWSRFAETSWNEARRFLPILAAPLFADIRADEAGLPRDDSLIERLAGLDHEEAVALLKTAIAEEAANILRLPAAAVDPLRPLSEMGMDSLMAVELRLALESRLRVDLPLMSLAEGTSVASIATRLANAVAAPAAGQRGAEPGRALRGGRRRSAGRGRRCRRAVEPIESKSAAAE